MYNLPNLLTLSRIVVIPVIFLTLYINSFVWQMFTATLFVVASITDYFDGYLARKHSQTSDFGRLLDPIADKLLVSSALVLILAKPDMVNFKISYVPAFVILCREILVSGLREFLREVHVGLPVTRLAKWKTGFQMTALAMMLFNGLWHWNGIGEFLLWIAGALTFITGYQYFQKSLNYIKKIDQAKTLEVKVEAKVEDIKHQKPERGQKKAAAKTLATKVKAKTKAEPKKRGPKPKAASKVKKK